MNYIVTGDELPAANGNVSLVANAYYICWSEIIDIVFDVDMATTITMQANAILADIARRNYRAVCVAFAGEHNGKNYNAANRANVVQLRFNEKFIGFVREVGQINLGTLTPLVDMRNVRR